MVKQLYLTMVLSCIFNLTGNAQEINLKKTDANGLEMLLGKIDKTGLIQSPYASWFVKQHQEYEVDSEYIKLIKNELKNYKITVFMGTWCGDSRREVPRFYKILEAADYPIAELTVIAVDYEKDQYKKSPGGEENGLHIIKVPTFIFYKKEKAINRIVESPIESLEKDIQSIIFGKKYIPNYNVVPALPVD